MVSYSLNSSKVFYWVKFKVGAATRIRNHSIFKLDDSSAFHLNFITWIVDDFRETLRPQAMSDLARALVPTDNTPTLNSNLVQRCWICLNLHICRQHVGKVEATFQISTSLNSAPHWRVVARRGAVGISQISNFDGRCNHRIALKASDLMNFQDCPWTLGKFSS